MPIKPTSKRNYVTWRVKLLGAVKDCPQLRGLRMGPAGNLPFLSLDCITISFYLCALLSQMPKRCLFVRTAMKTTYLMHFFLHLIVFRIRFSSSLSFLADLSNPPR